MDRVFGDLLASPPLGRAASGPRLRQVSPMPEQDPATQPRPLRGPPSRGRASRQPPPDPRAMPLQVRTLDDASAPAWDAFVDAMPDGTFFHRAAWARVIERGFGHRTFLHLRRTRRRDHRRAAAGAGEDAAVRQYAGLHAVLRLWRPACGRRRQRRGAGGARRGAAARTGAGAVELRDRAGDAGWQRLGRPVRTSMSPSASRSRPTTNAT